jgi:myosin heavy subunit
LSPTPQDKIYTYVSSILISVNPFKLLPIYTPEVLESYRSGGANKAPHVFAVADAAYNAMLAEKRHQSVVISGESGSGKSEATKLILQYLAETSSGGRGESAGLEQQILQSNPLMESFGNAKTVRNNNSR